MSSFSASDVPVCRFLSVLAVCVRGGCIGVESALLFWLLVCCHAPPPPPLCCPRLQAVCVGGGYIGMECAACLAMNGLDVTVVFPEDR